MVKTARGWAGVINCCELDLDPMHGYGIIYRTRKEAQNFYTMVVRVEVREVKPRRRVDSSGAKRG